MLSYKKILTLFTLTILSSYLMAENTIIDKENNPNSYNFFYNNETLRNTLIKFARQEVIKLNFSDSLDKKMLNKAVNGEFKVTNRFDLLDVLGSNYGFSWFKYGSTVYICSKKLVSQSINISSNDMSPLRSSLQNRGLIFDKFSYNEIPTENKIIVSGPLEYVKLVISQIKNLNISPAQQQIGVYRLKYANATDTTLNFNNQNIIIPGVVTILQGVINGNTQILSNTATSLSPSIANNFSQELKKEDDNTRTIMSQRINIQADNRLNAVIVNDKASNQPIYAKLIELLDVETSLIQVDVLIVSLDLSKLNQKGVSWWASNGSIGGGFATNGLIFQYGQINPGTAVINSVANIQASINFLEKNSIAQTVSRPVITTIDNIPAIINSTQNNYIQNNTPVANNTTQVTQQNNNSNQTQITTALSVTPHLISNKHQNKIKLSIALLDGDFNELTANGTANIIQNSLNSQAIVYDGQSLLLAGYTKSIKEQATVGIPLLMDIPLLGWFFKTQHTKDKKIANLYIITPHIVNLPR